ncbi:hypothetical protein C8R45DRAFT_489874 [Mycena sanguinolenta]|nr:hypothetical protein C8R45DRAFT_489874 [Mycena sanguinolenta]
MLDARDASRSTDHEQTYYTGPPSEARHTAPVTAVVSPPSLASRIASPFVGPDDADAYCRANYVLPGEYSNAPFPAPPSSPDTDSRRRRRRRNNNSSNTTANTGNSSNKRKRTRTNVDSDRPAKRARTGTESANVFTTSGTGGAGGHGGIKGGNGGIGTGPVGTINVYFQR